MSDKSKRATYSPCPLDTVDGYKVAAKNWCAMAEARIANLEERVSALESRELERLENGN